MRYVVASIIAVGLVAGIAFKADAQAQLTLLSPNPIEATINKLIADFEKKSGVHVNVTYGTGVSTRKTWRPARRRTCRSSSHRFPKR
jgi:ABC-type molybdate transport system substrate-binding protein